MSNGYHAPEINRNINRQLQPHSRNCLDPPDSKPDISRAYLPYIHSVTDRIGKILRKEGIRTTFKPPKKIQHYLPSSKDPLPLLSSCGVYKIPCSCGHVYIAETGRSVQVRLREHKRCMKSGLINNSAVAKHHSETGHQVLFDNTEVLAKTPYFYNKKIREAVEIQKFPNNFNRDDGYHLSSIWFPILQSLTSSPRQIASGTNNNPAQLVIGTSPRQNGL